MTFFEVEVRASSERHDAQAQRLAREIISLPPTLLPPHTPFTLRSAQLYHLTGDLTPSQLDQLTSQLLVDPVIQEAHIVMNSSRPPLPSTHCVDVCFHQGVTDTLAQSVVTGARMLGIPGLERVETGRRYEFDSRLSAAEVRAIAEALLYNPVIQRYTLYTAGDNAPATSPGAALAEPPRRPPGQSAAIAISGMSDAQLLDVSRRGLLALSLAEMRAIQRHYQELRREPSDVEIETLAQTWSEHCSHKTFKAQITYRELDSDGGVVEEETIAGLLKQFLMRATDEVKQPWLVSAFSDNAGIMRFSATQDIAFKVETHNHPSAIEPFGGANTGVGGVIRDVLGVSAQPLACTDVLCFGPLETPGGSLPPGVLAPRRIASGVIGGVRDYGNKMGIPTVNGAVLYHPGYLYNPLVFCGCLGILPHGSHPRRVRPGDRIVVLGGRTGRDGIHGATFSSAEMSSASNAQAGSAVQIGAPITEKKLADVIVQARDRRLYAAITDCGAGGFSSAIGEMGAGTGVHVELEKAPLKYQGLAPWEIWLSEAQERMVLAVPPENLAELDELCAIEEVEVSVIGTFTGERRLVVAYAGQVVADLSMEFLHDGRPARELEAVWQSRERASPAGHTLDRPSPGPGHYTSTLLALLRHPTIASKEAVVRRYDHEVQGATVLKPLVGRSGNGPSDAAVLRPQLHAHSDKGIVISNGVNPLYGALDPFHMATSAVDEALRNLTAVGGDIRHAAILDNFCWGNPDDPEQLGMLVRAVKGCYAAAVGFGTPFISGKDSLNNEYRAAGRRLPVMPTLVISAVGVIDDAARTVDMSLKAPANLLYLLGTTRDELGGSHYAEVVGRDSFEWLHPLARVPQVHFSHASAIMQALGAAIRGGLVCACHDLSEGGLAIALAEMVIAGELGAQVELSLDPLRQDLHGAAWLRAQLFGESASRFIVEVAPARRAAFEEHMHAGGVQAVHQIGMVTSNGYLRIDGEEQELVSLPIAQLREAWRGDA